ncbi:MAG: radical SAM protein [Clostridia bacterium]|nr:radical SAM protein [Clostridia bacterium]
MILMMKANKGILWLFQRKELMPAKKCADFLETFKDEMIPPMPVDIRLKHSQYTIEEHKGRTYLLYNTLYSSMLTMSEGEYEQYRKQEFHELDMVEVLTNNGFLIPEYTDEFKRYNDYRNGLYDLFPSPAHYTVVLTTRCNARCIYCYEEGVRHKDMSVQTAEQFSQLLLSTKKDIDITWFGGEPLLKTELIDEISKTLHQNNKEFTSRIITNGSLLNEEIIRTKFRDWHIDWVQITIDGMAEEYTKRKCYYNKKENYFEKIIENIDILLENKVDVSIRLNTDSENREECLRAAAFLKEKYPGNLHLDVYPAFLTGDKNILHEMEKRISYVSSVYRMYPPEAELLASNPKVNACFYQQPGAFVIDVDGGILCCDRDVGKQKSKIGTVYDIEGFDKLKKPEEIIPKVRKQCSGCVYYPKCGGGCRAAYNSKCEYDACFMERYKTEFLINKISGVDNEVNKNYI